MFIYKLFEKIIKQKQITNNKKEEKIKTQTIKGL